MTPADLEDVQRQSSSFESMAHWGNGMANLVGAGGQPERVSQALVSANFFDVVGVQPTLGRAFQPGEDEPGRERLVILSDRLWQRRFGGDRAVIGQNIRFDDENFIVIGVMPSQFRVPMTSEVWTPYAVGLRGAAPAPLMCSRPSRRLKPGAGIEQASADVTAIAGRLQQQYPNSNKDRRLEAWPLMRLLVERETKSVPPDAPRRGDLRAPDRLRQRRQPPVRAGHRPSPRGRGPDGPGRVAMACRRQLVTESVCCRWPARRSAW